MTLSRKKRVLRPLVSNEGYNTESIYNSWQQFKQSYPKNAEVLVSMVGEPMAIDIHKAYRVVPEWKAETICSVLKPYPIPVNKGRRIRA
jgi:hypothetical protein